jgi:hypothetical protein
MWLTMLLSLLLSPSSASAVIPPMSLWYASRPSWLHAGFFHASFTEPLCLRSCEGLILDDFFLPPNMHTAGRLLSAHQHAHRRHCRPYCAGCLQGDVYSLPEDAEVRDTYFSMDLAAGAIASRSVLDNFSKMRAPGVRSITCSS